MEHAMPPSALLSVLAMVKHPWPKQRFVARIGASPGGCWRSSSDIAKWVGVSPGRASVVLKELAEQRVIVRGEQSGSRPHWSYVNPEVLAWRGVPWTVDRADLALRLQAIAFELAEQEVSTVEEAFFSRLYGARRSAFVARSMAREEGVSGGALVAPMGRATNALRGGATRASIGRATNAPRGPALGRDTTTSIAQKHFALLGVGNEPGAAPASGEEERRSISDDTAQVVKAIKRRRGGGWLNGRPLLALDRLVERHGVSQVLEALVLVPTDLAMPVVVDQLAIELATLDDDGQEHPAVHGEAMARELVDLDTSERSARATCDMYETDLERCAADPKHWATYQSARAEVERCENRRAELRDTMKVRGA